MVSLTDLDYCSSDSQHVEIGSSRKARDGRDLKKVIEWFQCRNPFLVSDSRLHSLSSGITASDCDGINCDEAEQVGSQIMIKMDNLPFTEVSLKKIDLARTLSHVGNKAAGVEKRLSIDTAALFSRLIIIMQRCGSIEKYFSYELSAMPTALFKDSYCLRKTDKSVLAKELVKEMKSDAELKEASTYVVDGGWLLHKVKWQQSGLYADTLKQYAGFIRAHFGDSVTIVFDGYNNGPSIKDHEHNRRSVKTSPDVLVDAGKPAFHNQSLFLTNDKNKQ